MMSESWNVFGELFSRSDRALVRIGFIQNKHREAKADWKTFAREELKEAFFDYVCASKEAETLISMPPRKLLNNKGQPTWGPAATSIVDVESLFVRGVCQVRNNLFHGHKYVSEFNDISRDEELVSQAKWVLEQSIERCPKLRTFFIITSSK